MLVHVGGDETGRQAAWARMQAPSARSARPQAPPRASERPRSPRRGRRGCRDPDASPVPRDPRSRRPVPRVSRSRSRAQGTRQVGGREVGPRRSSAAAVPHLSPSGREWEMRGTPRSLKRVPHPSHVAPRFRTRKSAGWHSIGRRTGGRALTTRAEPRRQSCEHAHGGPARFPFGRVRGAAANGDGAGSAGWVGAARPRRIVLGWGGRSQPVTGRA